MYLSGVLRKATKGQQKQVERIPVVKASITFNTTFHDLQFKD